MELMIFNNRPCLFRVIYDTRDVRVVGSACLGVVRVSIRHAVIKRGREVSMYICSNFWVWVWGLNFNQVCLMLSATIIP